MNMQAEPRPTTARRRRWPMLAGGALLALLAVGLVAGWMYASGSVQRAIRDLPTTERRAFYERTLRNLDSICAVSGASHLEDFCREEAERALLFPECDDPCQALAGRYLPQPSR